MAARKFESEILATGSAIITALTGEDLGVNPFVLLGEDDGEDDDRFESISENLESLRRHMKGG